MMIFLTHSLLPTITILAKDKAFPVKTSKRNFVTFFVYFGNSLLD